MLGTHTFIGAILFYVGVEKLKFGKQELRLENHKIDYEILPDMFVLRYYHIIFILLTLILALFFNLIIGVFYFTFIVLDFLGAFFKWNIYIMLFLKSE